MLGARISELRSARNWTQVDLAKRLRVAKQTVSNWENENIQPSIEMLMQLSKLFNVTTDYLLGTEDTPRISVAGLPDTVVAHICLLIDDYRKILPNTDKV